MNRHAYTHVRVCRTISCTALSDFALRVGLLRLWRGCDKSVTTTAKSLVKAAATACGGGLTASACRVASPASCLPVMEGT